jgi:hypothetical protein
LDEIFEYVDSTIYNLFTTSSNFSFFFMFDIFSFGVIYFGVFFRSFLFRRFFSVFFMFDIFSFGVFSFGVFFFGLLCFGFFSFGLFYTYRTLLLCHSFFHILALSPSLNSSARLIQRKMQGARMFSVLP